MLSFVIVSFFGSMMFFVLVYSESFVVGDLVVMVTAAVVVKLGCIFVRVLSLLL